MPMLQGFNEVTLSKPLGKTSMTVTNTTVRFNKATAAALGYPAYVKVLVNEQTKQVALAVCTGRETNALKFSKPEGKQIASVTVKDDAVLAAVQQFFEIGSAPEGEIAYQAVEGVVSAGGRAIVFDAAAATAGTMKQRGRRKAD